MQKQKKEASEFADHSVTRAYEWVYGHKPKSEFLYIEKNSLNFVYQFVVSKCTEDEVGDRKRLQLKNAYLVLHSCFCGKDSTLICAPAEA